MPHMRPTVQQSAIGEVEVLDDGRTVWVNHCSGYAIGRFGPYGIDVHRTIEEYSSGSECLACTHGETHLNAWRQFQALMQEHYAVTVSDRHMPSAIRVESHLHF